MVKRDIDALRDGPGLVRRQKEDPLLGNVREALVGEVETRRGERIGGKEVARYTFDDQDLVWYEVDQSGILSRRTSVIAVPAVFGSRRAPVSTLPAPTPRGRQDVFTDARPLPFARDV